MANQTNKILIILVSVLIILLVIAVIMFSAVIRKTDKNVEEKQIAFKENKSEIIDIEQIEEKNEVLVAYLDGQQNLIDNNVIVIGTDKEINNDVKNNSSPYYIKVNVQANVVTIYKKDGNGKYNIPLKAMICSCGAATPVEGTYSLKKYNNWEWKTVYEGYARYATQISGDILFQSVPYTIKGDNKTLKYSEYDRLGEIATVGSVQLKVIDAKWIYENCQPGTQVTFYTAENAGPLGTPTSQQITEDEQVRGWDPTDPDENNPWKTYVRPEKEPEEEKKEENQQENSENTTLNDNTTDNNETNNNTVSNEQQNNTQNNTDNNSTIENNTIDNNTTNNITNNITDNQINTNTTAENKILEQNDDVTIKSEVIDINNIQ